MDRRTYCALVGTTALSGCSALSTDTVANDVGESYTTESELEVTLAEAEVQSGGSVVFGNDTEAAGGSSAITFVIPRIVVTNTTESALSVPSANNFTTRSNGTRQQPYQIELDNMLSGTDSVITEPVSGPLFPSTNEIGPEEEAEGWLVFAVPEAGRGVVLELRLEDDVQKDWSIPVETDQ